MDPDSWLLLILYVLLVLTVGYFASAEMAYVSANHIRLKNAAEEGSKRAKTAVYILEHFDRTLTTVLIGTNLAQIALASVATVFAVNMYRSVNGEAGPVAGTATALATAVTTIVVFLCGDMIPKNIAKENSEKIAKAYAPSLYVIIILLTPLEFFFSWISKLLSRLVKQEEEPTITEEELSDIIDTISEEGVIDEDKGELLQSALEFSKTTVADVLTLRDDIVSVDVSMSDKEIADFIIAHKHSRLPVTDGSPDRIVGVLVIRDFLRAYISQGKADIRQLMRPPFFVKLTSDIDDLLSEMSHNRFYLAIVQDADGATCGVVTIEDFLEELVGEIFDEDDVVDDKFMKLGGNRFSVGGSCTLGEMFVRMRYTPPQESYVPTKPVHIWVLENLGREPLEDDTFEWKELSVEVTDVKDGRVEKTEVKWNDPTLEQSVDRTEQSEKQSDTADAGGDLL